VSALINPFWLHSLTPLHPHTSCSRDGSFCLYGSPSARAHEYGGGRASHLHGSITPLSPSPSAPLAADPNPTPSKHVQKAADERHLLQRLYARTKSAH